MKILDLLAPDRIMPDLQASNKRGVLEELAKTLVRRPRWPDPASRHGSAAGSGAPGQHRHRRQHRHPPRQAGPTSPSCRLSFGRSLKGVDFDSMDGKPSHLFFLLLAPVNSAGLHLKALAKISRMLMSQPFRDNLMKAPGAEEIYRLIAERDAEF